MARFVEFYLAVNQREQGPIATRAYILSRDKFCAALANQDAPRRDDFTAESFYTKPFADAIATVPDAALTFLMCHKLSAF